MAILFMVGCSNDLATCTELPAPVASYETVAQCQADRERASAGHEGDYSRVLTTCFEVSPEMMTQDSELVWDIDGSGHLIADVEPVNDAARLASHHTVGDGTVRTN